MGKLDIERTAASDGTKPREPRRNVLIQARMRYDGARADVCIRNVSSQGFLIQAAAPPPRGSYVEIFIGSYTVVGRVVWGKGHQFGIRTQVRMDVSALAGSFAPSRPAPDPARPSGKRLRPEPQKLSSADLARRHERSRQLSVAIEFGCIAACGAAAALFAAGAVYELLSHPMQRVSQHLQQKG